MAITANMTTHDGVSLTNAYIRITSTYVKKIEDDEDGTWKLVYDVEIYKDKATRDDKNKEKSMRISNRHLQHFKIDYDITTSTNPVALAYADLKANENLSNVSDA